jgi:hypothetical protein
MKRRLLGLAIIGACGMAAACDDDDDGCPPSLAVDAGTDVTVAKDAAAPPDTIDAATAADADAGPFTFPACSVDKPFETPVELIGLGGTVGNGAFLADELTVYFAQTGSVVRATRTAGDQPFSPPALFPRFVHTTASVSSVAISDNGLTMWVQAGSISGAGGDTSTLYKFTRATTADEFDNREVVAGAPAGQQGMAFAGGGLWLTGTVGSNGGPVSRFDLTEGTSAYMTTPANLANYWGPAVTRDESRVYFRYYKPGGGPTPIDEIRVAQVAIPLVADQATITTVTELKVAGQSTGTPFWISKDGCRLYFRRTLPDGTVRLFVTTHGK